jgi:DNA-binding transcriptional regulator YdaS (Cro superfamily)
MSPSDLQRALAAFDLAVKTAGSYRKLGKICGCAKQNLHAMRREDRPLSHQYVLIVERELNIPRQHLRPDLYPQEEAA